MTELDIAELVRLAFTLILKLAGPPLAVALAVGLLVAMLQAITQINEATLVFIPKVIALGAVILYTSVSMYASLADFTSFLIDRMIADGAP